MWKPDTALTVNYGQISAIGEMNAAINIAQYFKIPHEILQVDVAALGSGQMAGKPTIEQARIPELWPFRNQLLITLTAMKFADVGNVTIAIGSAKGDSSHQDGTKGFIDKMASILRLQEGGVDLVAPAIDLDSLDLMMMSDIDTDVLDMTFSCFVADYPCGQCRGCLKNEMLRATYFDRRPTCG
jgi:7-cyano-7-deazaguanine synthase